MKVPDPFRCDYCKRIKEPSDTWFLRSAGALGFYLMRWDAELAEQPGYEHICSQGCAVRAFDRWASLSVSVVVGASLDVRERSEV